MAATHYRILSVGKKATPAEIRKAWKAVAFSCHPDRSATRNLSERGERGLSRRFRMALEAYEVLKDEKKRKAYDRQLETAAREKKTAAARRKREEAARQARQAQRREEATRWEEERLRRLHEGRYQHAVITRDRALAERRHREIQRRRYEEEQWFYDAQERAAQDALEWQHIHSEIDRLHAYIRYFFVGS